MGLSRFQMHLYKGFFHFPTLLYREYPDLMLAGTAIIPAAGAPPTLRIVRSPLRW